MSWEAHARDVLFLPWADFWGVNASGWLISSCRGEALTVDVGRVGFPVSAGGGGRPSKLLPLWWVTRCLEHHGVEVSPPHSHHCLVIHPLSATRKNVSFLHSCPGGKSDLSPGKLSKFTFLKKCSASASFPPFLQCILRWRAKVAQSCPTLCDPMDKPKELK